MKILEKNHVKTGDIPNMFSKEEIIMLEDLKYIKKQYPKYFE